MQHIKMEHINLFISFYPSKTSEMSSLKHNNYYLGFVIFVSLPVSSSLANKAKQAVSLQYILDICDFCFPLSLRKSHF